MKSRLLQCSMFVLFTIIFPSCKQVGEQPECSITQEIIEKCSSQQLTPLPKDECLNETTFDCEKASECIGNLETCDADSIHECIFSAQYCIAGDCDYALIDCHESQYFSPMLDNSDWYDFHEAFPGCINSAQKIRDNGVEIRACLDGICLEPENLKGKICGKK